MAGMTMKGMVGVSYRNQWTGVSGSPQNGNLVWFYCIAEQRSVLADIYTMIKPGLHQEQVFNWLLQSIFHMKNDAKLSLGIEARGLQYKIDYDKLQPTLGNDPVLGAMIINLSLMQVLVSRILIKK
jgi:hypothetical protein